MSPLSKEQRLDIANTIRKQLGGGVFCMMTGARNFLALDSGVQFMIPQAKNVRKIKITLGGDDLYAMEFYSVRGTDVKLLKFVNGLYADQLQRTFTEVTGLATSL